MKMLLTALSPVHIWDGVKLSPYTDYVEERGKIYYIDTQKISSLVSKDETMMDEYVTLIKNSGTTTKKRFSLKDFFKRYDIDFEKYIYMKMELQGNAKTNQIASIIKTSGRPYIPGSSIKGALRTVLLQNCMKARGIRLSHVASESKLEDKKLIFTGGSIFRTEKQDLKSDVLKFLYVSDTTTTDINRIKVYREVMVHLPSVKQKKDKGKLPVLTEGIKEGTKLEFDVKWNENCLEGKIPLFREEDGSWEKSLFKRVNEFSRQNIEYYIKNLKDIDSSYFSSIISKYNLYLTYIDSFLKNSNGFVIRLGSHKNFYDNTVARNFDDKEMEYVKRAVMKGKYKPSKNRIFPATDWFIAEENYLKEAPGWMMAELY